MPRPRIYRNKENKNNVRKGVKRKSKVVDHTSHRTYIVAQQIHISEKWGYIEEEVYLFGKDEDMTTSTTESILKSKNFISIPKGSGKSIRKIFSNMKDFKLYLKEIDGIIL